MEGGIDDVGIGVLFGLELYRYELAGILMHAEHLEAVHGVGPHTISVPRIKRADDIDPDVKTVFGCAFDIRMHECHQFAVALNDERLCDVRQIVEYLQYLSH